MFRHCLSFFRLILLLTLFFSSLEGASKSGKKVQKMPYVVLGCRKNAGVFSVFLDVLALVKYYDKGLYSGIEVDFQHKGLFYSQERGRNWWSYYCEPIAYGKKELKRVVKLQGDPPFVKPYEIEFHTTREEANALIEKYFKFKPHILDKVEKFVRENFSGRTVLGIHYRGTDKVAEAPRVEYERVLSAAEKIISQWGEEEAVIFVATDEQPFIDAAKMAYGNRVCCYEGSLRSSDGRPVHFDKAHDPYEIGECAIIDSLLLSKTSCLLRTSSNLSLWSTYFCSELPVVEISSRW